MFVARLGLISSSLCRSNRPTCLWLQRGLKEGATTRTTINVENLKNSNDDDDEDKPIPYLNSAAAQWKARYLREPPRYIVWYTPHVVGCSLLVFLLYFCVLREENDIDDLIYRPLTETIEGVETLFPNADLTQKPDYILYHERVKAEKEKLKAMK